MSYTERTGSTALIDTLKMIDGFKIPVFEDLDFWWQEAHCGEAALTEDNVHDRIDSMYELQSAPDLSVGFKWRVWGVPAKVAAVLKKHRCTVFNLTRCEPFEYISSLYLSHIANSDFNSAQFKLIDAKSPAEQQDILDRYRKNKYVVDVNLFFELFNQKIIDEHERLRYLTNLQAHGVILKSIYYEDFSYKRYIFLRAFLADLSSAPLSFFPLPALEKVTTPFPSSLFDNRNELLESPRLMEHICRWNNEVTECGFEKMPLTI